MDHQNMTSPCGLDCFNCPLYLAGRDEELRKNLAARLGVEADKVVCRGCRNEGGKVAAIGRIRSCRIFQCVRDKKLNFCFECGDFPCDHLHPYADQARLRPHNTKVFNLCLIRKMGLDRWAVEKAAKVKETYFNGTISLD